MGWDRCPHCHEYVEKKKYQSWLGAWAEHGKVCGEKKKRIREAIKNIKPLKSSPGWKGWEEKRRLTSLVQKNAGGDK